MKYDNMKYFFIVVFAMLVIGVHGQRVLDLQTCVDIAYERSLALQNSNLARDLADINSLQARHARFPTLNGSTSYNYNVGRTIDPTSNDFVNQSSNYQTVGFNTGMTLFRGGVISNTIKQTDLRRIAALRNKEALMDNIGLQVAQNYLNALLAQEAMELAEIQIELTQNQLDRIDKLITAGSLPANDRLELEAQRVRDEQQIVIAENNYQIALLNLKNLLLIDEGEEIELQSVNLDLVPIDETILHMPLQEVYEIALSYQPSIKADSMELMAIELDEKINKGRLYPSVQLGGSISTNYSTLAKRVIGSEDIINDVPVVINGMTVNVGFPGTDPVFDDTPYFDQLDNNLGYGFGLSLTLPIYNNYAAQLNLDRSEINTKQVRNQNELNRQNLKSTIQSAVTQARAARQVFLAAQKSVIAQEASLANLEKKLNAGTANNFDFINAKNSLNISENSLVQSKYDYIFKLKVIDYYLGKPLKL